MTRGIWKRMAYTLSGRTATLYEDGVQVSRNTNITLAPKDVENTIANYLGKPAYLQDNYFKGKIKEFKIYDRALSAQEILLDAYQSDEDAVEQDYQQLSLGDTSGITSDFCLPLKGEYGSTITWISSDTRYITDDGKVTRPPHGNGNVTVTLTALIKKGTYEKTKEFQVTILEDISDEQKVKAALDKISIPNKDDIRGNITLPETIDGLPVIWTASPEGIISTQTIPAEENDNYAPIPAGVVTRPEADTKVELTATITLNEATSSKVIEVTVRKKPEPISESDYKAYLFTYFTGEGRSNGEQIYFATSRDGLFWDDLNDNEPVLTSDVGEKGVRDPYIIRSPEGDKFYMVATDLKIYGNGDWNRAQRQGSKSIVVWESTDLVNWSEERLVKVARDDAGCTWAPEIVYDDKTGEYLVFWASRIGADNYAKQRIYIAKTRDFYTFTEPQVYIERAVDVIDATIIKHDSVYYRFSKDETNKNVIMDKCDQLLGKPFTPVSAPVVEQQRGVEGPAIYKLNGENKWVLLLDNYGGRGYYPLVTTDLASGNFTVLNASEYRMPTGPRHGTVISITQDEYEALMEKWNKPVIPPDEEPQQDPVLEYNFDEVKTDNIILDVSGNNRTGSLHGNATYVMDPEKGSQVLYLDGANGTFAAFPQGFFDGRDTFSISMDIKPETVSGNFFTFTIGKNNIKYMFLKTSETQIRNAITVNSYQNEQEVKGNLPSSIKSKWMNLKLVITPTSMTIYKDGVLLAENKNVTIKISDLGTDLSAYLGKSFYSADAYFKGYFDNVKVYNRELTLQEIIAESNRIKLSQLIAAYANINEAEYTPESYRAFRIAYDQAAIVANKADATDEEVSEAFAALEDAISKLIKVSSPDENREHLILHYEFNDDITEGIVRDSSGKGNDGIIKGTGAIMKDGILTLTGNAYVELPTGMFDRKDTLTITTWLKNETGKGNYSAMFFGTTEYYPVQYWLFNPCNPDGRFKSVITNSYNASSPWSTEYGISPTNSAYGIAGPLTDNNWAFYTTVIEPNQITAYYNGVKIGTVAVNRKVSDFGNNLVAYLGKSSYPDILLKGFFKDVKVYTTALTETQVRDEMRAIDIGKEGTYTVTGTVLQPQYPNPLIEERADPWVILGGDGWYYFTASYPVRGNNDPEGYDRIILRRSRTIEGLKDAEEITIWHEKDSPTANRYIWAPELHNINGKWYVLFTASRSSNVWDIRPHILACEGDGDPFKPENWVLKGQVKAAPGDTYAFTHFSLDMTYFESNGKHYLAWAEKPSSSDIMLATIDPEEPWQLTSPAILISTPQYGWEWNGGDVINEGPAVLKHDGKIYLFFSASSVDRTYCVGMLWAYQNADLMDSSSWTKIAYPLLTSNDLYKEYGPGHNSFTVDANGNVVIVYHARPEDCAMNQCAYASSSELNDPCRHARVKNVHFAADGTPVLNMTYEEELVEQFRTVTATIIVTDVEEAAAATLSADSVVQPGSTFTVTLSLDNLNKGVFAEDITISYDDEIFEYVETKGANENIHIVREAPGNGIIRIIAANIGGVTGESSPVLNISFKVKSGVQGVSGSIAITKAELGIAPEGTVITPQLTSKSIQVAIEEPTVDKRALGDLISAVQAIYDAAIEGMENGQYPIAAKAALLAAINAAKAVYEDDDATQPEVDNACNALQEAKDVFEASIITESTGDLNKDGTIDIGDLAISAFYYGKTPESEDWNEAKVADVNRDGIISIEDLAFIALRIKE
ncbi:MAG: family 43 glycosylhydrolase [Clostridiaceae bacterium]|nr:family 43 glycosylhydrolase [Clostridiaceae bacterium]